MKCPYCGKEMEKGEVQVGDTFNVLIKSGVVSWVHKKESKKLFPKTIVSLASHGNGYYCEQCAKVVAIFDEKV